MAVGAMLAQEQEKSRVENAIYFMSRKLQGSELNYSALDKSCTALVWDSQHLKIYLQSLSIQVVSRMDALKYILEKPSLSHRLAKWAFLLNEFDMTYSTPKSIKWRVIADQLVDLSLVEEYEEPSFPDEEMMVVEQDDKWQMFFDGAANNRGYGIGVLLIDPQDMYTPIAMRLEFEVSNNTAEYEACLAEIRKALDRGVRKLEVFRDSALIINQIEGKWKMQDTRLRQYHEYLTSLLLALEEVTFHYLPRDCNCFADVLATLASLIEIPSSVAMKPFLVGKKSLPAYYFMLEDNVDEEEKPWYFNV